MIQFQQSRKYQCQNQVDNKQFKRSTMYLLNCAVTNDNITLRRSSIFSALLRFTQSYSISPIYRAISREQNLLLKLFSPLLRFTKSYSISPTYIYIQNTQRAKSQFLQQIYDLHNRYDKNHPHHEQIIEKNPSCGKIWCQTCLGEERNYFYHHLHKVRPIILTF